MKRIPKSWFEKDMKAIHGDCWYEEILIMRREIKKFNRDYDREFGRTK